MRNLLLTLGLFTIFTLSLSPEAHAGSYVALGDSITSGTNAVRGVYGNDYSWAVGARLDRTFAKALSGNIDQVHALSIPGATAQVLLAQALVAKQLNPSFVTIEIGGNDFAWGLGQHVVPLLRRVIRTLSEGDLPPQIFLGTIPDLEQVYQLGQGRWPCEITHWLAPLFLKAPLEKRMAISAAIHEANEAILAMSDEFPNITVVNAVDEIKLSLSDISEVDCIHPSAQGQQRIADAFIRALIEKNQLQ